MALALAEHGMDVAISWHRSSADARRTVRALRVRGARATAFRADLRNAAAARRLVDRTVAAFGRLDVLVNNAGMFRRTPFLTVTPETYDAFLDVNLRAAFFGAQAAASAMRRRGGHIVNIADAAVMRPMPGFIPYAVSKAAHAALTMHLSAALRRYGIAVNAVAPGLVLRPRGFPVDRWRRLTRGRTVPVEDVTTAVVRLSTCPAAYTGRVVSVDSHRATSRSSPPRRR
jgi:NAD(P)-dependent dehydrogenase (short-subunit alcohol dehydrogenase family)